MPKSDTGWAVREVDYYRLANLAKAGDACGLEAALREDPELEDDYGKLAMVHAAAQSARCVELLLEHGHKPGKVLLGESYAVVPIACAAVGGRLDCMNRLLEAGADIEERGGSVGASALMMAAKHGRVDCCLELLARGADLEAPDADGNAALAYAAMDGASESLSCLLGAGADIDALNAKGESALCLAGWGGRLSCVEILLGSGADAKKWRSDRPCGVYSADRRTVAECDNLIRAWMEKDSIAEAVLEAKCAGSALRI
jgi:ankyrin repeat protein